MKNPFKFFRSSSEEPKTEPIADALEENVIPESTEPEQPVEQPPADPFVEWCRSQVRGGIERRERNDIFEAYNVYGVDEHDRLTCRRYHRYPEHERDFDLSYSRTLTFDELNRRLLSELDKGDIKLSAYHDCIAKARALCDIPTPDVGEFIGFTENETAALREFCETFDTLTDKEYRSLDGVFCVACRSVVGDEQLNLRFRKPLPHDALDSEIAGVSKTPVEGYDIESLWIMGVYNRLRDRCQSCRVTVLTSEWSLQKEKIFLMQAEGFSPIDGTLLLAVADETSFLRFGFYSLDFSNK